LRGMVLWLLLVSGPLVAQEDPDHWLDLGRAHSADKQWDEALEAYHRVLELRPDHAKAMNNIGNVYFRQNRFEEASTWYTKALALEPDYLNALYHDGWVLRQLNRLEAAEERFRSCLVVTPKRDRDRRTQLDCMFFLGTLRSRQGDYGKTAQYMEQVLRAYPAHAEARYYLGTAYRQLGRMDEARQQLELHHELREKSRNREPIARDPAP